MEGKTTPVVQNILSAAIEAASLTDSQRRFGGSCQSLTSEAAEGGGGGRRSRIPLPHKPPASSGRDTSSPLPSASGRSTPALRRENSLAQIHFASKKKVRPKKKWICRLSMRKQTLSCRRKRRFSCS